jgi:hypothetical protein
MTLSLKIENVRDKLRARKGDYQRIAFEMDISYWWLVKFAKGTSKSPDVAKMAALENYFNRQLVKIDKPEEKIILAPLSSDCAPITHPRRRKTDLIGEN